MITDELKLRSRAIDDPADAHVLADAYERDGQLFRARLWRGYAMSQHLLFDGAPPDLIARRRRHTDHVDPRRDAMIWLLRTAGPSRWTGNRLLSGWFKLSTTTIGIAVNKGHRRVSYAAFLEASSPTMLATNRLRAAGAVRELEGNSRVDLSDVELPPDDWPYERVRGSVRYRTRPR